MRETGPASGPKETSHGTGRLGRRDFLRLGMLGAASLGLAPTGTVESFGLLRRARANERTVIIGAGMAGLTAGLELAEVGHDVTILEARTRPGGRVHTLRAPFPDGLYAEAGAARIPETHDLTRTLCRRMGIELEPFRPDTPQRYVLQGKVLDVPGVSMDAFPLPFSPALSRPGEMMNHHRNATAEGRVHFAGEHTSVWPGWIQGAIHSGLRAAREVGSQPTPSYER